MRLVLELEEHLPGGIPVVLGDLTPQRHEPVGVAGGVGVEILEVVEVEDDRQIIRHGQIHQVVDPLERGGVDRPWGSGGGAGVPPHRQPNRVEAGTGHQLEELIFDDHSPLALETGGLEGVTEVDAPAQPVHRLLGRPLFALGGNRPSRYEHRCGQHGHQQSTHLDPPD